MKNSGIPIELSKTYKNIYKKVCELHYFWKIFIQLYGINTERIELLNKSAISFFSTLQYILTNEIMLNISKLLDPSSMGRKGSKTANLSLYKLIEEFENHGDETLTKDIKKLVEELKDLCKKLKIRRNKDIAHFDYDAHVNEKANFLPDVSRGEIQKSLNKLSEIINIIEKYYKDNYVDFDVIITKGDVEDLINVLKEAMRYRELVRKNIISPLDLKNLDLYNA